MTTAKKGTKPAKPIGPTPDPYTPATPREKAETRANLYKNRADFFRAQIDKEESEHPEQARPGWPEMKARLLLAIKADDTAAAKYAAQARALKIEEDRIEAAILARMKGGKKKPAQDPTPEPEPPAAIGDAADRPDLWPDKGTDEGEDVEILPDDEIQTEPAEPFTYEDLADMRDTDDPEGDDAPF